MKSMTLLLCLALPVAALASTDRVYRWTDKDGVVHYSQTEPPKVRTQTVEIRRHKENPVVAPPAAAPPVKEKAAATATDVENCAVAKANAKILAGKQSISLDKDGDGKLDPVSDEDRKNIQAETEKQIGTFCKEG